MEEYTQISVGKLAMWSGSCEHARSPLAKRVGWTHYSSSLTRLGPLCITCSPCGPTMGWVGPHK